MDSDKVSRTLARLEADRSEIDTMIKRYNVQRAAYGTLLPIECAIYRWLRQRRMDLTTQIEEMQ